jgi:hypothetical protein
MSACKKKTSILPLLVFMPRRHLSPSPWSSDSSDLGDSVRCRLLCDHPLGRHALLHRLRDQSIFVQQQIVIFGPDFRVSYSPVNRPDSSVVAALREIYYYCPFWYPVP